MHPSSTRVLLLAICGALLLGSIGFFCGYAGNFLLAADPGTAAPLNAFLTTPLSIMAGAAAGALCGASSMTRIRVALTFLALALITAVLSLAVTAPEYRPEGNIVEAEVGTCTPVSALTPARIAYWKSEVERVTRDRIVEVPADWANGIPDMIASHPGVVLKMHIRRSTWVEERVWRSGRKNRRLRGWERQVSEEDAFFPADAGACSSPQVLAARRSKYFLLCWERSDKYPPDVLSEFLGVSRLYPYSDQHSLSRGDLVAWSGAVCPR